MVLHVYYRSSQSFLPARITAINAQSIRNAGRAIPIAIGTIAPAKPNAQNLYRLKNLTIE